MQSRGYSGVREGTVWGVGNGGYCEDPEQIYFPSQRSRGGGRLDPKKDLCKRSYEERSQEIFLRKRRETGLHKGS